MTISRLSLYALVLCLVACGGGGGGGGGNSGGDSDDDDGDSSSFDPPVDTAVPLEYEGVKLSAVLDVTNVGYFVFNTLADSEGVKSAKFITANTSSTDAGFRLAAVSGGASTNRIAVAKTLTGIRSNSALGRKPLRSDAVGNGQFSIAEVSDSYDYADISAVNCESGQTVYYLMLNDDGTGLMVVDHRNCREDSVTIDGLLTYDIFESNPSRITHATINFNRLTSTINGQDFISSGSVEFELDGSVERTVMNVVYELENGVMLELENLEIEADGVIELGDYSETISGRVYDSASGYVDITTLQPVVYTDFMPIEGELMLAGMGGSKALLEFPRGNSGFAARLDSDGDDIYENTAVFNLARLAFGNTDIADNDADGMHNSWETFYGLDSEDPADATLDLDADSVNNRGEYRVGYDPNDIAAVPPSSDLEVFRELLGTTQLYLTLRNNGPDPAGYLRVNVTASDEFELEFVANTGCSITDNILSCKFEEELDAEDEVTLQISVDVPETATSYEADVYSLTSADQDENNNHLEEAVSAELTPRFTEESATNLYVYRVENTGALAARVQSQLVLPAGVSPPVSITEFFSGSCGFLSSARMITCQHNEILPGQSQEVRVGTPSGSLNTEATVVVQSMNVPESNLSDNKVSFSGAPFNLVSDMYINPMRRIGTTGSEWGVNIIPRTNGPNMRTDAQITIDLPPQAEFISIDADDYECTGTDPIVCTIPQELSTDSSYPSLGLRLISDVAGTYEFPITVETTADDPVSSNNTTLVSVFIGDSASSIQADIDAVIAGGGGTVTVPAGYYRGELTYSGNINLVGAGPESTFWNVSTDGITVNNAAAGEISGFTFTDGSGIFIELNNSSVNINNNIFENLTVSTTPNQPIVLNNSSAIVERNILRSIDCSPASAGMISITGAAGPVIRNNLFLNNGCPGVFINNTAASPAVIMNNDFINSLIGVVIPSAARSAGAYVGNNIFHSCGTGIQTVTDCSAGCPTFQSNLFYDNDLNYQNSPGESGVNDILAGPLFTNAANGDYTLQSGSPAIDAGDNLHAPTDDFLENSRPVDGDDSTTAEPDIGAYEFQVVD